MPSAAGRPAQRVPCLRRIRIAPAGLALAAIAAVLGAPRDAGAQCPPARPFMCPKGSCVGGPDDCASVEGCPASAPHRCSGGRCAPSPASCDTAGANPTTLWFGPPEPAAGAAPGADQPVDEDTPVDGEEERDDPEERDEGATGDAAGDDALVGDAAAAGALAPRVLTAETVSADLADGLACPEEQPVGCEEDVCCPEDHPWCCGNGLCGADDACAVFTGGVPAVIVMTPADPEAAGLGALGRGDADDVELDGATLDDTGRDDEDVADALAADGLGAGGDDGEGFAFTGGIDDEARGLLAERDTAAPAGAVGEDGEVAGGCDASTPSTARASTATTMVVSASALGLFVATLARMRKKRRGGRRYAVARY